MHVADTEDNVVPDHRTPRVRHAFRPSRPLSSAYAGPQRAAPGFRHDLLAWHLLARPL